MWKTESAECHRVPNGSDTSSDGSQVTLLGEDRYVIAMALPVARKWILLSFEDVSAVRVPPPETRSSAGV